MILKKLNKFSIVVASIAIILILLNVAAYTVLSLQQSSIPIVRAIQDFYKSEKHFSPKGNNVTEIISPFVPKTLTPDTVIPFFENAGFTVSEITQNLDQEGVSQDERLFIASVMPYRYEFGIGRSELRVFIKFKKSVFETMSAKFFIHSI